MALFILILCLYKFLWMILGISNSHHSSHYIFSLNICKIGREWNYCLYFVSKLCNKNLFYFNLSSFVATDDHFHLFKIFLKPFDASPPFKLLVSFLNTQLTCEPLSNQHHNAALLGNLILFL